MRRITLVPAAVAAAAVVLAPAGAARTAAAPGSLDRHWLQETARGDLFEIAGARIAQTRATTPGAKALATRLEADHRRGLNDAGGAARRLHVRVAGTPTATEHWELHVLTTLSGPAFDRMYTWLEVAHHVQDLADAQEAAAQAQSPAVRALARRELPMLRAHLRAANAAKKAAG